MRILRGNDPRVDRLAAVISRAALDPAVWQDVVTTIVGAFPGLNAQHGGMDCPPGDLADSPPAQGFAPVVVEALAAQFRRINPWWPADLACACPGSPTTPQAKRGDTALPAMEAEPCPQIDAAMPLCLREPPQADVLRVLAALVPTMRHALQVNRALLGLRTDLAAARAGLDTRDAAVMLLDRDRRVIFANDPAGRLLDTGHHVMLSPPKAVIAEGLAARTALDRAAGQQRPGAERILSFARGEIRVMHLLRLPADDPLAQLNPLPSGLSVRPAMILVVAGSDPVSAQDSPLVAEHGLTPAEAEVVLQLAFGRSPREIAQERLASVHTVRNQIKSALAKTGLRRQSELAVLGARTRIH